MNEGSPRRPISDGRDRPRQQSWRGQGAAERPILGAVHEWSESGRVGDRLSAAVTELVAALRDEMGAERRGIPQGPDRLLSIEEAARVLGIGRTALYSEIGAGRIRSVKVGRRRLIPSSVISEIAARQG